MRQRLRWLVLGLTVVTIAGVGCASGGEGAGGDVPAGQPSAAPFSEPPRYPDPLPRTSGSDADVVLDWMDLHTELLRRETIGPPIATRILAYSGLAMQAAAAGATGSEVLPVDGVANGELVLPDPPAGADLNPSEVVAAAGAEMTRRLIPGSDAHRSIAALEAQHLGSEPGWTDSIDTPSVRYGRAVAAAVDAYAGSDGYDSISQFAAARDPAPGAWEPTPPGYRRALEPEWGELRPFAVADEDCPVPDPVPYSEDPDSAFFAEAMAVYEADAQLTEDQRQVARYWDDRPGLTSTPAGHWVHIARQELEADVAGGAEFAINDAATVYAVLGIAQADAFIANWRVKYRTDVIRPVTYLRNLVDPEFLPFLVTPPFPEYPSGHSTGSAAAATVLASLLGERSFTDTAHERLGWDLASYGSFAEAADEASMSRLYGGIHFPMGLTAGQEHGRCLATETLGQLVPGGPGAG